MKTRYVLTLSFAVFSSIVVNAQNNNLHHYNRHNNVNSFVKMYTDSLNASKIRLDSVQFLKDSSFGTEAFDGKYSRMFVPMTFYHDISSRMFSLQDPNVNQAESMIDNTLLGVYLHRPDLVYTTESKLDSTKIVDNNQTVIDSKPDIVEKVAPKPSEADVLPINVVVKKPNFWKYTGDAYLQFLQNYISGNWYKGGESSYSMLGSVTLQANYNNKQKVKWDNKLELQLGFQTSRSDTLHSLKTTSDLIRYTGKLGFQATKKWYYTFQLIANTQFMKGYKNNDPLVYSNILSPLNVNLSIGMDYSVDWLKHKLTGSVHLAPLAFNYLYVDMRELASSYGIESGKRHLSDYGSTFNIDLTYKISEMVSWKTRIYGYTTYKRAEFEWENTISFNFNKYISSNLYFYPRLDDNRSRDEHHGYWGFKEFLSVGLTYSF